jgi:hypothetical protein
MRDFERGRYGVARPAFFQLLHGGKEGQEVWVTEVGGGEELGDRYEDVAHQCANTLMRGGDRR